APDYAHWHGMYEVAERFYVELVPQAREIADHAEKEGHAEEAAAVRKAIDDILARPEHQWFESERAKRAAGGAAAGGADAGGGAASAGGDASKDAAPNDAVLSGAKTNDGDANAGSATPPAGDSPDAAAKPAGDDGGNR
ncbi:MAG: hypothetical protein WD875_01280, partial [Pirellulales bacterium]